MFVRTSYAFFRSRLRAPCGALLLTWRVAANHAPRCQCRAGIAYSASTAAPPQRFRLSSVRQNLGLGAASRMAAWL